MVEVVEAVRGAFGHRGTGPDDVPTDDVPGLGGGSPKTARIPSPRATPRTAWFDIERVVEGREPSRFLLNALAVPMQKRLTY